MHNTTHTTRNTAIANERSEIIDNARSILMATRKHLALGAAALVLGASASAFAEGSVETRYSAYEATGEVATVTRDASASRAAGRRADDESVVEETRHSAYHLARTLDGHRAADTGRTGSAESTAKDAVSSVETAHSAYDLGRQLSARREARLAKLDPAAARDHL